MSTLSTRMGMKIPATTDRFSTQDVADNWSILDGSPGTYICTSTTRPGMSGGPAAWTSAQVGRKILEVNTGLEYVWSGSTFKRMTSGHGILTVSGGTPAIGERTGSPFSTTSTSYVKVVSIPSVQVPAGNRPLLICGIWFQADNDSGPFQVALIRSNTNDSGPVLSNQVVMGNPSGRGYGGQILGFERSGLAAGTYDFSLQAKCLSGVGGTVHLYPSDSQPIQIVVIEL